jgi:putative transposase
MSENTNTESRERGRRDALMELMRTGARQLIAEALEGEVTELLATYGDKQDDQGRAIVVRNGHQPEREIQTGIGPVTVQVSKVRSRQGEPVTFRSALCAQDGEA